MTTTVVTHKCDGKTIVEVVLSEHEAWDGAVVLVSVRKPTYTDELATVLVEAREWDKAGKDGTLYISATETANDGCWENDYPDYFSDIMELVPRKSEHTHGLTTTVDGEVI
jgi:hypothetical protein